METNFNRLLHYFTPFLDIIVSVSNSIILLPYFSLKMDVRNLAL